jgi:hypothetical protein
MSPPMMDVVVGCYASDYMIHFVKEPLFSSPNGCDCKACDELGLFESLRMPRGAYDKVHANLFPLPIPEERRVEVSFPKEYY